MTPKGLQSFAEFWPYYLAEHRLPRCRALHYVGSLASLVLLVAIIAAAQWAWLWVVLVAGYGPAWFAHFVIERNRPATFTYPRWSLIADYKMCYLALTGQLAAEMKRLSAIVFPQ